MTELGWAILNIGILIFLLILGFRLKKRLGIVATLICFALVIYLGSRIEFTRTEAVPTEVNKMVPDSLIIGSSVKESSYVIDKGLLADLVLAITHGKMRQSGQNVPITAIVMPNGWNIATVWETKHIDLKTDPFGNRFLYTITGNRKRNLFGITVQSVSQTYTGAVPVHLKGKLDMQSISAYPGAKNPDLRE